MSTLFVDNVAGQGGGTETNLMEGLCVAWMLHDLATDTIDASYNTSSVTDNGTGTLTWNYTNAFVSERYTTHFMANENRVCGYDASFTNSASARSLSIYSNATGAVIDNTEGHHSVVGDRLA